METPKPRPHAELIKAWADGFTIQTTRRNGEWEDIDLPSWNEKFEYRIRPDNEPWSPKTDEKYFYLDVFNGEFCAVDNTWNSTDTDYALRRNNNIFPTKEEAEAAIPLVESALKGTTDVNSNVGSNVGCELDDKPLTDGEKALIRALRGVKICRIPEYLTSVLCFVGDAGKHVLSSTGSITFLTGSDIHADKAVVAALKQIKAEQEASND